MLRCEVWYVQGMQLKRDETLVGMSILPANVTSAAAGAEGGATPMVLLVTAQGLGKRVPAEAFKLQHRAGMGNIAITCNAGDRLMALHVVCCVYPPCTASHDFPHPRSLQTYCYYVTCLKFHLARSLYLLLALCCSILSTFLPNTAV